jgi:predicted nucleotidyltransferase
MQPLIAARRAELIRLCHAHHVRRLDVFGSAASGAFDRASSDIDFLVDFEPIPPRDYADAYFSLKERLEALFGCTVDLVTESSVVNPFFRRRVNESKEAIFGA